MTVDAELARWGEPPVNKTEEALMAFLDKLLDQSSRDGSLRPETMLAKIPDPASEEAALVGTLACIQHFVAGVLEQSKILGDDPKPLGDSTESYDGEAVGSPEPPKQVPEHFRIRRWLGDGHFGRVWLADHLRFDIPVALKALHFHITGEERDKALAILENEARVLARLQHPNVVRVFSLDQAEDSHYLAMQFVDGGSLQARLDRDGPLGWQLAARYVADVGEALVHVHEQGIVHRDIKPANILWDRRRDEALLTDFGLAGRLADCRSPAGTPLFMAPEAFDGQASSASDVYSLTASLFALVTGSVPFPARTTRELRDRIYSGLPDPEPLLAGVPERLEALIRSGLAASPENRPQLNAFVAELRGSLNRLLADSLLLSPDTRPATPVDLRLSVSRRGSANEYMPIATTHPAPRGMTRDMTKVPPAPERIGLRTGDHVRIEVLSDCTGFVRLFNVGPTGRLNLLYPDPSTAGAPVPVPAHQPLHVLDVAMTPPAGNERLFAVWSRTLLPLETALALTRDQETQASAAYRATRDMERVQKAVQNLPREDWHAVVLELDHQS
jgi:serine/threonine protein kinase